MASSENQMPTSEKSLLIPLNLSSWTVVRAEREHCLIREGAAAAFPLTSSTFSRVKPADAAALHMRAASSAASSTL
jgi:hypothetical protein